ncbi:MAG: nucleotidyltransferase domain-containing protein [Chitinophagia bacterium]|nr:nucleotidyltransferase domain-containing protein [Chitinophagia bacterium]
MYKNENLTEVTIGGISQRSYNLILSAIAAMPEIDTVLLFGSRAKGKYSPGSDIDLAVKGENFTLKHLHRLSEQVNEELPIPYHIDITHYSTIKDPLLKQQIDHWGIAIYQRPQKV